MAVAINYLRCIYDFTCQCCIMLTLVCIGELGCIINHSFHKLIIIIGKVCYVSFQALLAPLQIFILMDRLEMKNRDNDLAATSELNKAE